MTAKSVGSRMIQYANSLAQAAYQVASTDPTTGELTYVTDAQGVSVAKSDQVSQDAATLLKSFTTNVEVVRQLTLFFGYGSLGVGTQ